MAKYFDSFDGKEKKIDLLKKKSDLKNLKALALKYPQGAEAPFIIANESGFLAGKMLEIAEENNIPLVENADLTNVLSFANVGDCIPEETWLAVASIFAYISKSEKRENEPYE